MSECPHAVVSADEGNGKVARCERERIERRLLHAAVRASFVQLAAALRKNCSSLRMFSTLAIMENLVSAGYFSK